VSELVAYAKAHPGKLNCGSGLGTTPHIAQLADRHRHPVCALSWRGPGDSPTSLLAYPHNHRRAWCPALAVNDGKLRGLAVTSPKRGADFLDLPTIVESGYPDFPDDVWWRQPARLN
jgi:tripartite-type tricarboxylate transporter receptor subunit TctC